MALRTAGDDFHMPSGSRTSLAGGGLNEQDGDGTMQGLTNLPAPVKLALGCGRWSKEHISHSSLGFICMRLSSAAAPTPCWEHKQH